MLDFMLSGMVLYIKLKIIKKKELWENYIYNMDWIGKKIEEN